jgi:hypothetical protein
LFDFFFILPGSATTITIGDVFSENEVTTSLIINDVSDVITGGVEITYDPSVVLITKAKKGNFSSFITNLEHAADGLVRIGGYNINGLNGNVKLAELTLTPQGNYGKLSNLAITVVELTDSKYNAIDAEVVDGFFYIGMNGDVLADRVIDVADSEYIARGIAGIPGYPLKFGPSEVSGDGIVDAYDCVYLARHAAGVPGYEVMH